MSGLASEANSCNEIIPFLSDDRLVPFALTVGHDQFAFEDHAFHQFNARTDLPSESSIRYRGPLRAVASFWTTNGAKTLSFHIRLCLWSRGAVCVVVVAVGK
jgi:hypothetical protein